MKKVAFIDRDGTINVDKHYLKNPSEVELIPGSADAIKSLNDAGYMVFGISNQSGVARGFFTDDDVTAVNRRVIDLVAERGGVLEEIFYCPHHLEGSVKEFSIKCACRKPQTGMIKMAEEKYSFKSEDAVVFGDKICDVELAQNAGIKSVLVGTGYGEAEKRKIENESLAPPDFYAANLNEAVNRLLGI